MEVVSECAALLSNYEVISLLEDINKGKNGHKKPNSQQQNLATVCYETLKYLEKTPCKQQNPKIIQDFCKKLEPFKLTKAEKLQLLNQRPTTAVEIQLLIEESEERLSEEQTDKLLDIISECVPDIEGDEEGSEEQQSMDDS